jgi:hypothetical protein
MATEPPNVGGPPPLWDGGPTRAALVIPNARVTSNPGPIVDRRRLLWRDSATILIGLVIALLAAQALLPGYSLLPTGSPTPEPSGIAIGSFLPPLSLAPGETFGPIIDPSLGIDATPTPIPVITLGPSPSPTPSPSATPKTVPTPKPSTKPKPTPTPAPNPTPTPAPTPVVTPPPTPPTAGFTWAENLPLTIDFTNTSTNDTSWDWDFGDGQPNSSAQNPTHVYLSSGTYNVTLTVQGPGGSDAVTIQVDVT